MISTIIVDDESKSRSLIRKIITKYTSDINVVGEADDIQMAFELIVSKRPNIVFLDIEMPSGTGLDLLRLFPVIDFEVIFISAYNDYAIQAIELNCLSYILKPISIPKLLKGIDKAKQILQDKQLKNRFENLLNTNNLEQLKKTDRIALPTVEGLNFVEISKIVSLEADGSYTWIQTIQQKNKIISSKTLKEFEALLQEHSFLRVHRKHIINLNFIAKYVKGEGGHVEMDNRTIIPISKRRKHDFLNQLNRL